MFINIERDFNKPIIVYKLLDGFKIPGYVIEINWALYGLWDFPAL